MSITAATAPCTGFRFSLVDAADQEIGHAYLYLMRNDLHTQPFGLMEDVFIAEDSRGRSLGTQLIQALIKTAKERGCYKLIATSRQVRLPVHQLYTTLGFHHQGLEFRIDF